jgi:hypothetical protein
MKRRGSFWLTVLEAGKSKGLAPGIVSASDEGLIAAS